MLKTHEIFNLQFSPPMQCTTCDIALYKYNQKTIYFSSNEQDRGWHVAVPQPAEDLVQNRIPGKLLPPAGGRPGQDREQEAGLECGRQDRQPQQQLHTRGRRQEGRQSRGYCDV